MIKSYENLHKYQLKGVEFALEKTRCALYLGMGLGKTIITLSTIPRLLQENQIAKVLIIAPLRIVKDVWHNELSQWEHTKHLTYSIIHGTPQERLEALNKKADIYLINQENVQWLFSTKNTKWGMIVLDESSAFKSHETKKFKALAKFTYKYMIQLSGTPDTNNLLDLWAQIYLLDRGERLGKSFYAYRNRYFYQDFKTHRWLCHSPQLIYDKIADITMSMKAEDYLELPPMIPIVTKVEIDNKHLYNKLKDKFIAQIESKQIIAANAAALTGKLLQFCNGAIYDEDKNIVEVHDNKIRALEELREEYKNDNILVAYNYQSDLKRLLKRFKDAVVLGKEGKEIKSWNEGKIKLLLCHPASCGKGLNLQGGGNIIVWFGLTWSLENYLQFNARLHRQGQLKPVIINHIVAKNCMDEKVMMMLSNKKVMLDDLLDYLKTS